VTLPDRQIHVIGVPLDLGGGRRGVDMGPSAIRIAGLGERLSSLGYPVVDRGDVRTPIRETLAEGDPTQRYIEHIARVCRELYGEVSRSLASGAFPVVLGGDHSLAAGSVAAASDIAADRGAPIGLLWIDAHGDMNTPATSESGNVHGMPLAALLGAEPADLARIGRPGPKVRPEHTVLLGVRNLDDLEKARIRDARVHLLTMKDIDRQGIAAVMEQAIALAGRHTAGLYVSFDLDVCDPSIAPGVGTPVKGGLDYREAHMVMEMLADSGRLLGIDLVEVNPVLDIQNQTAVLAAELVLSGLGKRII
jgi:arginase